jgi:DNA-binding MarR family transcriptional regulator
MTNVKHGGRSASGDAVVDGLVFDLRQFVIGLLVANLEAAEAVGLNPSDLGCLCLLLLHGPSPAGRLARLTGLTTGAITGVIDRLERAGFAQRVLDPGDRRKVIVKPDEAKVEQELLPRFAQLNRATRPDFYNGYTEDELAAIGNFLARLIDPEAPSR